MVFNMTIYNKTLYEKTGEHLSMIVEPAFCLREIMRLLKCEQVEDLAIRDYDLPFTLTGTTWEEIKSFAITEFAFRLREIQGTPYGSELITIAEHFFEGDVKSSLRNLECIHFCKGITSYTELLAYVIDTGIVSIDFLYKFLNVGECVRMINAQYDMDFTEEEFKKNGIEKIIKILNETTLFQLGDFLNHAEAQDYLKKSFNVLETRGGFFINQQHFLNTLMAEK